MDGLINIPVTWKVFEDLREFMDGSTVTEEVAEIASKAITAWIEQHRAPPPEELPALRGGFQWKEVFLPTGTKLRIIVRRKTFHAAVVGDQIIYNDQVVTPASLVNQLASTKRNAWKHIWLFLLGETKWRLAESMRD